MYDPAWTPGLKYARIRLHSIHHEATREPPIQHENVLNTVSMHRIGSLLHELCHAILDLNSRTGGDDDDIGRDQFKGHGFAWQRIACWVEFAALHGFGLPLDLDRFQSLQWSWAKRQVLPTLEEITYWELSDP